MARSEATKSFKAISEIIKSFLKYALSQCKKAEIEVVGSQLWVLVKSLAAVFHTVCGQDFFQEEKYLWLEGPENV